MLGHTSNAMLAKAEEGIQSQVPQNLQGALKKTVDAGLTVMYSDNLAKQRNERLANGGDPANDAGQGAGRLIGNLYQQSGQKMPPEVIVPAAMIFAFEYLDLVEQAGKVQVTGDIIAQATKAVANAVLPMFGVTPEKLQELQGLAGSKQGGAAAPQAAPGAPASPAPAGIIGAAQAGQ